MGKAKSPVTLKENVKKIASLDVERITKQYRDEININVTRHFEGRKEINIYKCGTTGYRFYYPFECIGDGGFYEELSKQRPGYYSARWEHKEALQEISQGEKVLEVGSGFGYFLKRLKEKNITATGLELNPYAVNECKKAGLEVKDELIQNHSIERQNFYDVICAFQVLEHIADIHSFLISCINLLKKDGRLIIGVPNNNPYLFKIDKYHTLNLPPHHAGMWNKKSLKNLEKVFPLKLEKIKFEPLDANYTYFFKLHTQNNPNFFIRLLLRFLNQASPRVLRKIIISFVKGRNIFVVFRKV